MQGSGFRSEQSCIYHQYRQHGVISEMTQELLNLRAVKFSYLNEIHIFQCTGNLFCMEFQRQPLKFPTKYLTPTLKDAIFTTLKFSELLDLRAHVVCFWNTPWIFMKKHQHKLNRNTHIPNKGNGSEYLCKFSLSVTLTSPIQCAMNFSIISLMKYTYIFIEENHSIEETHFECLCTLSKSCTNCRCRSVDSEFRFHCFVLEPEVSSSSFALTTDLLGIHMEELLPAATLCHWARLSLQRYKKSSMCAWFLKLCSAVVIIMYVQGLILELINISGIFQLHVHLK